MYATVEIANGDATDQVTLPQTAITYNPYGDTVFVVQKGGIDANGRQRSVVQQRFVQLGATRGDQVVVQSGVAAGDVVVSAGQMKLHNGTDVVVDNSVQPSSDMHPSPPNE
jgi:membrane fusion protein (multidrug efflux system)